jgi:hypothetical protein
MKQFIFAVAALLVAYSIPDASAQLHRLKFSYFGGGSGCGGQMQWNCTYGAMGQSSFSCGHPFQHSHTIDTLVYLGDYANNIADGGERIQFDLNEATHTVRNLKISFGDDAAEYCTPSTSHSAGYMWSFDPFIYTGSLDSSISTGNASVESRCQWSASFSYSTRGTSCSADTTCEFPVSCNLNFEVLPAASFSVAHETQSTKFRIISSASSLGIYFSPNMRSGIVLISDYLGRDIKSYLIPADQEFTTVDLDLTRGCYFARLGNEVAKFVVTE